MTTSIITRLVGTIAKLNSNSKIHKYRKFHEKHHFILVAMEVYGTFGHDMDHFIKKCVCLFHDLRSKGDLSLSFCVQFFKQCVNIVL